MQKLLLQSVLVKATEIFKIFARMINAVNFQKMYSYYGSHLKAKENFQNILLLLSLHLKITEIIQI